MIEFDWDENKNKVNKNNWSIGLEQKFIAGNLNYQQVSNTLSGRLQRLLLAKSILKSTENSPPSTLKPNDIPNLNLTIDTFKIGEVKFSAPLNSSGNYEGNIG